MHFHERHGVKVKFTFEDPVLELHTGEEGRGVAIHIHPEEIAALSSVGPFADHPTTHVEISLTFGGQFDPAFALDGQSLQILITGNCGIDGFQIGDTGSFPDHIHIPEDVRITGIHFIECFCMQQIEFCEAEDDGGPEDIHDARTVQEHPSVQTLVHNVSIERGLSAPVVGGSYMEVDRTV